MTNDAAQRRTSEMSEEELRRAINVILNYPEDRWRELPADRIEKYNEDLDRLSRRLREIQNEGRPPVLEYAVDPDDP